MRSLSCLVLVLGLVSACDRPATGDPVSEGTPAEASAATRTAVVPAVGASTATAKTAAQMVAEANAVVTAVSPAEAIRLLGDDDVVFVDLREPDERVRSGSIPGAVSVPRGLLEFYIDSDRPDRREVFHSGRKVVFYCAGGGRSALATRTAMEMGLEDVAHVAGGFRAWVEAGGPVIEREAD